MQLHSIIRGNLRADEEVRFEVLDGVATAQVVALQGMLPLVRCEVPCDATAAKSEHKRNLGSVYQERARTGTGRRSICPPRPAGQGGAGKPR